MPAPPTAAEVSCDARPALTRSADAPSVVMPLGGIGTGGPAIAADGGLRQWQLHNTGNHLATLPWSFFALRLSRWEPPFDEVRVLQAPPADPNAAPTPMVNDAVVPQWQRDLLEREASVNAVTFRAVYPWAQLQYDLGDLPLAITLDAVNPLVPLHVDDSSVPAALFTFELRNTHRFDLHGSLAATLQNAVGWDGIGPVDGVAAAGYGGNTNRVVRRHGWTEMRLDNHSLDPEDPHAGQLVLGVDDPSAAAYAQWRRPEEFFTFLRARALADGHDRLRPATPDAQRHAPAAHRGASPPGTTWNTALAAPFVLAPGQRRTIRIALTWHFPNRYVDFEQFGPPRPEWGPTRFWLGNHYATRYTDAADVLDHVRHEWTSLHERTRAWIDTFTASDLTDDETVHLAAQLTTVRTPTCFRGDDGRFYAFEGLLGASTGMWSGGYGGSCPLNCTHVWNYAHAVAAAFPELERNMRATEFEVMQAPDGSLPHRLVAPTYLPQLHGELIGGPDTPALDGMLGAVLKTYREYRHGADRAWLERSWPSVRRLLAYIERTWNGDGTGMLSGVQPSTHDIDLCGHNTYQGTLWIAALRAAARIADVVGDDSTGFRTTADHAAAAYDEQLFTGEYYEQRLGPDDDSAFQWGRGCLSDQLIGQWWAHQLGLGHLLPPEHVRTALRSIVRHNLRHGFADFEHAYRPFAVGTESGLVVCSWPHGGRPDPPTRYADEVWTGVEYQVAAHCLWEGLTAEADAVLAALWNRYDGRARNPFNEVECGDHYVRAMAGWSVVDALAGFGEDAATRSWTLRWPTRAVPVLASTGWGLWRPTPDGAELRCTGGRLALAALRVDDTEVRLDRPVELTPGETLLVQRESGAGVPFGA